MTPSTDETIARYSRAHMQFYGRAPHDLRRTKDGTILLHGMDITAEDLNLLAAQLEAEAAAMQSHWRARLSRLWAWLNA